MCYSGNRLASVWTRTAAVVPLLLWIWCGSLAQAAPSLLDPQLDIEVWATGLSEPAAIAFLGRGDLLVIERRLGRVRRVVDRVLQPGVVYTTPGASSGDEFLLGIAVNDESPPAVFLYVEDQTGTAGNRVERHRWNPQTQSLDGGEVILEIDPAGSPANEDDGGYLLLGPPEVTGDPLIVGDGRLLYVAVGYLKKPAGQLRNDPSGLPPDNAGVIMRVHQDGSPAPGNPFTPYCSATTSQTCAEDVDCPGSETCTSRVGLYWSYGIRNVFGMAIDPPTSRLWSQENGEEEWDEINRVDRGMNSGWESIMGFGVPTPVFEMPGGGSTYLDPQYAWLNTTGPTGIAFPYGSSFGHDYDQTLLVADFNLPSNIYAFPLNTMRDAFDLIDLEAETQAELDTFRIATGFGDRAVAIEFGPDGYLYVVSHYDGVLYRMGGPGRPIPALPFLTPLAIGLVGAAVVVLRRVSSRRT